MAETLSLEPVDQPKLDLEPLDLEPVEAKAPQQPASNPYLTGWGYGGQQITSPEAEKSFTPLPGVASALEASSEMAPLALLTRGTRADPIRKAMASEVNKAVGTVLSPGGLAMIPAAIAAPEAMGVAGAALSAPSVVSGAKEAYEGFRRGDWAKAAGGATRAGIGGLVVAGGILPMAMRALKTSAPPTNTELPEGSATAPESTAKPLVEPAAVPAADQPIRIYRGEGGSKMGSVRGGNWFTSDLAKAQTYGDVVYIDTTLGELQRKSGQGQGGPDEFFLSPDFAAQAKPLKPATSVTPSQSAPLSSATPPVTQSSNGATTPPPPGSAFNASSIPPEDPIWPVQAAKLSRSFRDWWERVWPRSWAAMRQQPNTAVISEHQRFLFTPLQYMEGFSKTPWWQALDHWDDSWLVEFENEARQKYHERIAAGDDEQKATLTGIQIAPESMQNAFMESLNRYPIEVAAAKELGVEPPGKIEGPYLPRRTTEEGKNVIDVPKGAGNWGGVLRKTLGSFARSRVHDTMKEGIEAGTQYEPIRQAVWMRNLYSHQLEATAAFVRAMKEKGVLYDTKEAARAAGGEANPYQVRGLGGKDFYARNRQEGRSIEQNFDVKGQTPLAQVYRLANTYGRNPNLINPLPHTTKNMFFKYVLARVGNASFKADTADFKAATPGDLLKRFNEVMPISESGERLPNLTAKEVGTWGEKITSQGLGLNDWSSKFIFGKADPAMRYSLWKSYVRKGMSDQEAANNVWLDLIRYDENSGGINFWKSMPFNFFVPWRLGTYVTLAKAIRNHPARSLAFIGAVEYLREMRQRQAGRWTHLPVDYIDAPLAEAIEKPSTAPAIAATLLLFGPGGGQAPATIKDIMGVIHGDPGSRSRALNMFWGLSQIYEIPREFEGYMKDGKASHLVNILTSAALSEHSAIKYEPRRLMKWLPEWMPGMQKSELVRQAEALQKRVQQKQEKGQATYERRHGVGATFERTSEEEQLRELRRAAH